MHAILQALQSIIQFHIPVRRLGMFQKLVNGVAPFAAILSNLVPITASP